MSTSVHFTKLSATGNDFILIDNREKIFSGNEVALLHQLCQRRTGIGADGILLLEKNASCDFTMRYFNADGRESEMCGNGARATAYYAARHHLAPPEMNFEVQGQPYRATVQESTVRLRMRKPFDLELGPGVLDEPMMSEGGVINTGVPHYVIFVEDLERCAVVALGQRYRHHTFFAPAGTNVDFVQVQGSSRLQLRTYERGVEAETLACGTGAVAAAVITHLRKGMAFPMAVSTLGGELRVYGDAALENLELEGEVREVFTGQLISVIKS